MSRILSPTDDEHVDAEHTGRQYYCTKCETYVQPMWTGAGTFTIKCAHDSIPIVPQVGQFETPDYWRVRRPECCRDKEMSELTRTRFDDETDYECPDCGAEYTRNGAMIGAPTQ